MEPVPLKSKGVTVEKVLNTREPGKLAPIGAVSFTVPKGGKDLADSGEPGFKYPQMFRFK